jgi:hypothetical protein
VLLFRPRGVFRLLGWSCFCFLLLLGACADDHYTPPSAPACPQDPVCSDPPPFPGDPRYGLAAQILIQDTGCNSQNARLDCLWIGIDDPAVVDQILARGGDIGGWIRGTVIVDPSQPHGFYLLPSSTVYWGGGLIGGVTTNIDWVEADPARHDGGFWAFTLDLRDMAINP